MDKTDWCECYTCGYRWIKGQDGSHSCVENLSDQLKITNALLDSRQSVLDAIPECKDHGSCVPHALEWIEKAKAQSEAFRALIADDSYAVTFQTLGQYRTALLKAIDKLKG